MFRVQTLVPLALLIPLAFGVHGLADPQAAPAPVRVGVYDSRALAVAFAHSASFRQAMQDLIQRHDQAKAKGDAMLAQALEAEGKERQDRLHRQGLGTGSVEDILKLIHTDLPQVAERMQVDLLVSKWDVTWQRPGVALIDVTAAMVEPFHPDERALAIIADLRERPPLAEDDLKEVNDSH